MGWWTFDYPSGTSAYDSSGEGNTGSFGGDPTHTFTDCADGFCLDFDGTSDYVDTPVDIGTDNYPSITVELWAKPNVWPVSGQTWASLFDQDDGSWDFHLVKKNDGNMYLGTGGTSITTPAPSTGEWHHFVATANSNDVKLYIDGEERVNKGSAYGSWSNALTMRIGADVQNADQQFNGLIDDARVYNYALSSGQVKRLYNKGLVRHEGGLNIYMSCLDLRNHAGAGASGVYVIDPDGEGGENPIPVYCDM